MGRMGSWWEIYFVLFVGVVLIYALYLIVSGVYRVMRRKFAKA